jgi:DMSO/TMAO reductase YedYZ molybdopterin-dependent catalytic subunit
MKTTRRQLLALAAPALLAGCDRLSRSTGFTEGFLSLGNWLSYRVQRLIAPHALAPEFTEAEMSPIFRTNGNTRPRDAVWTQHLSEGFVNWRLELAGLVQTEKSYSLAELKAMPARTQITRHDCVEGWSAIGKWKGVPLKTLLDEAVLAPEARYIVFRCADDFRGLNYYESIDLNDATHPQTILAYEMNDAPLPIGHGAPIRLRVERQLGYKQAKFVMRVEAVASLEDIRGGRGGHWEDTNGYDWYAGI